MRASRQRTVTAVVVRLTERGAGTVAAIARDVRMDPKAVQAALVDLCRDGVAVCVRSDRPGIGLYRLEWDHA